MMKILFWCLVALNLTDFWLTSLILNSGGEELNPGVAWFIETFGHVGIIYAKVPCIVILGVIIYGFWNRIRPVAQEVLHNILLFVIGVFICLNLYSLGLYASMLDK